MISDSYVDLGISVIPLMPKTKQPHFNKLKAVGWVNDNGGAIWTPASREIANREVLEAWFGDGKAGIAMVAGEVSGNLVYIDWDQPEIYRKWARAHLPIINSTAVSRTAAGYHAFFRTEQATSGSLLYYEGEFAGHVRGTGMYVVAPPSIHPTGWQYKWLRHPGDGLVEIGSLAEIDIKAGSSSSIERYSASAEFVVEPVDVTDEVLLIYASTTTWCKEKFVRLYLGEWKGFSFPSQSEADLSLCRILAYWTGRDVPRIDQLFRKSGLFRRDKWTKVHYADGRTYGAATIDLACRSTSKVFVKCRPQAKKWTTI